MGGGGAVWCDCVLCVGCYMYGVNVLCMARDTCYKYLGIFVCIIMIESVDIGTITLASQCSFTRHFT